MTDACDCFWRPGSDGCGRCNPGFITPHCEMCEQEARDGLTPGAMAGHRCGLGDDE